MSKQEMPPAEQPSHRPDKSSRTAERDALDPETRELYLDARRFVQDGRAVMSIDTDTNHVKITDRDGRVLLESDNYRTLEIEYHRMVKDEIQDSMLDELDNDGTKH